MAKTIHIHLPPGATITKTRDAGEWEEGKHPRAENGQFGKGSGGGKPAAKKPVAKSGKPGGWKEKHDHAEATSHSAWNGQGASHAEAAKAMTASAAAHTQAAKAASESGEEAAAKHHTEKAAAHKAKAGEHQKATTTSRQAELREMGSPRATGQVKPAATRQPGTMNMSTLKEGQALYDKSGQKVDEITSIEKHPLGGWKIETRAGYSHRVDTSTGRNAHGLSNEPPAKKPVNAGSNGGSGTVVNHQPSGTTVPHQAAPVRSPQYTPMRQAMRKQEAEGIREARHQTKVPQDPTRLKSVVREGAEATLQEVLARIRARKQ